MDLREMFPMKLGFGGLRLPTNGEKDHIEYDKMCEMVDEYMSAGGKYFDTSFIYHRGKSEEAMAACVVDRFGRDSFCLSDKLPLWAVDGKIDLQSVFDVQLKKCHVDFFDFYLLHNVNRNDTDFIEKSDAFEFQQRLKREGKIRFAGFSFHDTPEMLDKILTEHSGLDFVQLQINYYDWLSNYVQSKKCYEVAVSHNMPVVVMETVRGGGLSSLPSAADELLRNVQPQSSASSLAIRFAASLDNVFMVLSGMSNIDHVKDNCSYMRADKFKKLSDAEYETIQQITKIIKMNKKINCIECGSCSEVCPENIEIDKILSIYNDSQLFGNYNFPEMHFNIHVRGNSAKKCIKCGACQTVCPKGIQIVDNISAICKIYDK